MRIIRKPSKKTFSSIRKPIIRKAAKKNFSDKEEIWDFIVENDIATDDEVRLVTDINGYNEGSLNDIIYARTGFRSMAQYKESEDMEDFACGGKSKKKFANAKTIREQVIDDIYESDEVWNLIYDFEIQQHLEVAGGISNMYLVVDTDGTFDIVELSDGAASSYDYILLAHLFDVGCNCDWCAEYENAEKAAEYGEADEEQQQLLKEFPDKGSYIKECINNNDIIGPMQHQYADQVRETEYGFFDDEKEESFSRGRRIKRA